MKKEPILCLIFAYPPVNKVYLPASLRIENPFHFLKRITFFFQGTLLKLSKQFLFVLILYLFNDFSCSCKRMSETEEISKSSLSLKSISATPGKLPFTLVCAELFKMIDGILIKVISLFDFQIIIIYLFQWKQ